MADYSVNSTQLSGSSGAGSQPVQAVQEQVVGFSIPKAVGDVVDIFAKGLETSRKEEAEKVKQGIVGSFVREQAVINDAVATGQMSPSEAAARQRAIGNKYLASYPSYASDFKSANDSLKGITEKGEIEARVETQKKEEQLMVDGAIKAGYILPDDPVQRKATLNAYQETVRLRQQLEDVYRQKTEARAQSAEDRAVADEQARQQSIRLLSGMADKNLEILGTNALDYQRKVQAGEMTQEEAIARNAGTLAQIKQVTQTVAASNPALAGPWNSFIDEYAKSLEGLYKPGADLKAAEDQFKLLVARQKLMAVTSNPKLLSLVVTSELTGHANLLALNNEAANAYNYLTGLAPADTSAVKPQVVGDPAVESDVYKGSATAIKALNQNKVKNPEKGWAEAGNGINNILEQTSNLSDTRKATPQNLTKAANFLAGPEVASAVKRGVLDPQLAQAAKRAFQMNLEPSVIKLVNSAIDQKLEGGGSVFDAVTITPTSTGVTFTPKKTQFRSAGEAAANRNNAMVAQSLSNAQQHINLLVKLGAHMEGSTDYQKYWEDNKHFILPKIYPDPSRLKVGQVVNGRAYLGGPWGRESSWKKVE